MHALEIPESKKAPRGLQALFSYNVGRNRCQSLVDPAACGARAEQILRSELLLSSCLFARAGTFERSLDGGGSAVSEVVGEFPSPEMYLVRYGRSKKAATRRQGRIM